MGTCRTCGHPVKSGGNQHAEGKCAIRYTEAEGGNRRFRKQGERKQRAQQEAGIVARVPVPGTGRENREKKQLGG